jgi:hypothetical protein
MTKMSDSPYNPEAHAAGKVIGILAEFDGPEAVKAAAVKVRGAGFRRWDVHSPFPIHGIERAMGMKHTPLAWLVLGAGATGLLAALLLQWWTNAIDYPLIISGKPYFSLPANVPIMFELLVLFSAIATFVGVLALNLLPQFWHWTFGGSHFVKATTDGFFISIDAADKNFDEAAVRHLLESSGAKAIEICRDVAERSKTIPWLLKWICVAAAVAAIVPPLLVAEYRSSTKALPRIHPILDMDFQEKYKAQSASPLWADGRAMRLPVLGTIANGWLEADEHFTETVVATADSIDRLLAGTLDRVTAQPDGQMMLSAPQIGVRHARRLKGLNSVLRSRWPEGTALPDEIGVTPAVSPKFPNISIPYGALVPQMLDGLLACGRHISCDANSHGFMREIPQCWITGQAAGVAAAVAVAQGVQPRAVDIARVQAVLLKQGVYLRSTQPALATVA